MQSFNEIIIELKHHSPFTALGAISGILVVVFFIHIPKDLAYKIFYILHPFHVFLSALVTAAIFKLHTCKKFDKNCLKGKCNFWELIVIGYIGSVGIATLSDCIIPFIGEIMLNLPHRHIHLGFIEEWWLVNPLALAGILLAYFWPKTKFPHAGHVLLSTWASAFHIIMAVELRGGFSFEELKNMGFKERLAKFVHPNDRALLFNSHIAKEWHDIENIRIKNSGGIYKHYKFTFYKSKFMGKDCIVSVQRDITDRIELIQENTNAIKTKTKAIAKKLLEKGIDKKIIAEVINL